MNEEYIIISSNKNMPMATTISRKLDIPIANVQIKEVLGSETSIDVESYVNEKKVFLLYDLTKNINNKLMNLLFLCDAIRKEGAKEINLITNYLPYTKIKIKTEFKLNFSLVSRLIKLAKIDKIYTFALYSPKISYYIETPIFNVPSYKIFSKILDNEYENKKDIAITSIDSELQEQAKEVAEKINCEVFYTKKTKNNQKYEFEINKNINGKTILIYSDNINSGKNIIKFSKYLILKGAKRIDVICNHGIIQKKALEEIETSVINKVYTSIHDLEKSKKVKLISTTPIVQEIIKRNLDKKNLKTVLK